MASIGHIAVGMAAARVHSQGRTPSWASLASWSALSILPDVDVIGFALGVDYADPWGHRGATHSLGLSVAAGLAIGLAARGVRQPLIRTAVLASAVLASHALLDTMTDGGLGCALFWPIDLTRYFAPWRPIPVAPIGPHFFSREGTVVALTELVLFAPLFVYALPLSRLPTRRVLGVFVAGWAVSAWLISGTGQLRESLVGVLLQEDTAYTPGFSEAAFRAIERGDSDDEVSRRLGAPIREIWLYGGTNSTMESASERSAQSIGSECAVVYFQNGVVATALDLAACKRRGVEKGMSLEDVERRLGVPYERNWQYTWSPSGGRHRMRIVCFTNRRVTMLIRRWN